MQARSRAKGQGINTGGVPKQYSSGEVVFHRKWVGVEFNGVVTVCFYGKRGMCLGLEDMFRALMDTNPNKICYKSQLHFIIQVVRLGCAHDEMCMSVLIHW